MPNVKHAVGAVAISVAGMAPSSRPDRSSCRCCSVSGITPESTDKPSGRCSARASQPSGRGVRLDRDYMYEAG